MARIEAPTTNPEAKALAFAGTEGGRCVVWLVGEHDAFTASELSETLARAMADDDGDLLLDLSGVDFMGVATVGVIVRANEFLGQRSRSLAVRCPSGRARRVLELCDVGSSISLAPLRGE